MKELKDKMINHLNKGKDLVMRSGSEPELPAGEELAGIIAGFRAEFAAHLTNLIVTLDEAGISHYSSGCGTQRVTFDIFPASQHVQNLLELLSLDRAHITKASYGLRDASAYAEYNPASEFLAFLRRWRGFAEQAMRYEGDSERGVSAARAKLIIDELLERLSQPIAETGDERRRATAFSAMMRAIGVTLEARKRRGEESHSVQKRENNGSNYDRALAKARARFSQPTVSPKLAAHLRAQSA